MADQKPLPIDYAPYHTMFEFDEGIRKGSIGTRIQSHDRGSLPRRGIVDWSMPYASYDMLTDSRE